MYFWNIITVKNNNNKNNMTLKSTFTLNKKTIEMMEFLKQKLDLNKSDIVRRAIEKFYKEEKENA